MSDQLIDLMCQRASHARLVSPGPNEAQLARVSQVALRAPDHMRLKPWRYLIIEGEGLARLGALFVDAMAQSSDGLSTAQKEKYLAMPHRAPMIIVGISCNEDHPKVPVEEQIVSCGVGMGYMLLALQSEGFGGMWRTGPMAKHSVVKQGLGVQSHETLVGFLYVGTPKGELKPLPELKTSNFFHEWN